MYEYPPVDTMVDILATVVLTVWTISILWLITGTQSNQIPAPPFYSQDAQKDQDKTNNWTPIGIYHLNKPHQLSKAEREALDAVGGGTATHLYQKIHPSGNKSWRYQIGDAWFYPRETAVRKRGLNMFGNYSETLAD
jgi:hypothetical protein